VDLDKPLSRSSETTPINHFKRPRNESGIAEISCLRSDCGSAESVAHCRFADDPDGVKVLDLPAYFYYCRNIDESQR
jgi:hypothetical protein